MRGIIQQKSNKVTDSSSLENSRPNSGEISKINDQDISQLGSKNNKPNNQQIKPSQKLPPIDSHNRLYERDVSLKYQNNEVDQMISDRNGFEKPNETAFDQNLREMRQKKQLTSLPQLNVGDGKILRQQLDLRRNVDFKNIDNFQIHQSSSQQLRMFDRKSTLPNTERDIKRSHDEFPPKLNESKTMNLYNNQMSMIDQKMLSQSITPMHEFDRNTLPQFEEKDFVDSEAMNQSFMEKLAELELDFDENQINQSAYSSNIDRGSSALNNEADQSQESDIDNDVDEGRAHNEEDEEIKVQNRQRQVRQSDSKMHALYRKKTLFNQDADNGLSSDKLIHNLNRRHARRIVKDPVTGKQDYQLYPICKIKTGWHCCTKKSRQSEFSRYGLGMVLYFQFLKHIAIVFAIMAVLSIPAYIFYFSGNQSDTSNYTNLKYVLAAFSLGNIGQSQTACNSAQISEGRINLFCSIGTLYSIQSFGQAKLARQQSCANQEEDSTFVYEPSTCDYTKTSDFGDVNQRNLFQVFNQTCYGKINCSMPLNETMIPPNCTRVPGQYNYSQQDLIYLMKATCQSDSINVFLNNVNFLQKNKVAIVVVLLDIVIAIFYYAQFLYLQRMQRLTIKEITSQQVSATDFTIQIKNLPQHENYKELKIKLWNYIEQIMKKEGYSYKLPFKDESDPYQDKIMNINFGFYSYKRFRYMIKMYNLIRKLKKQELLLRKTEDPIIELECRKQIKAINLKAQDKAKKIKLYANQTEQTAVVAYIQFQSMTGKEKFLKAMVNAKPSLLMRNSTKEVKLLNYKLLDGYFPEVKQAPEPSVIIWKNLRVIFKLKNLIILYQISNLNRFMRSIFTFVITLCVLFATIVALVATKYFQNKYSEEYSVNHCGSISVTKQQAYEDYLLPKERQVGLLACYCYNQLSIIQQFLYLNYLTCILRIAVKDIDFQNGQKLCNDWFTGYTLTNAMIYAAALAIVIFNAIILEILILLSEFQRYHTHTQERAASTIKMSISQVINTGIVILIVNARIPNNGLPELAPVFSGQFLDFSVEWYRVVGSTIMLAMIINIISPHFSAIFKKLFFWALTWYDRKFTLDIRRTRKIHQEDYEFQYLGIEFFIECRYAQIISTIYILMMYSSGMPLFYIVGLFFFLAMYHVDKFLFVRWYRLPPRYGPELSNMSRNILKWSVLVHLAFGFYMYSNSSIFQFQENQQTKDNSVPIISTSENSLDGDFFNSKRLKSSHTVIYLTFLLIIFVLFIAIELINWKLPDMWNYLFCFFRAKQRKQQKKKDQIQQFSCNIYEELSGHDLKSEYKKTKKEIELYTFLQNDGIFAEDENFQNFMKNLQEKRDTMKVILMKRLMLAGVNQANDTMDGFFKLLDNSKNEHQHRLRTEYSYDVQDHHQYRRSRKGEKQVRQYFMRLIEKRRKSFLKRDLISQNINQESDQIQDQNQNNIAKNNVILDIVDRQNDSSDKAEVKEVGRENNENLESNGVEDIEKRYPHGIHRIQ
eukprot:403355479